MSFWRQLSHGFRGLLHREKRESEIDAEVQSYFEEVAAAYRERGLADEDARRAALQECGNLHSAKEQVRAFGWENTLRAFVADLSFAVRHFRRNPGFTTISICTLGLGIGASTAIFSAINPILFKPLPYPHPGRILMIWNTWQGSRSEISFGTYLELSERSHSFDSVAVFEPWQPTMTGREEPRRLEGQGVSAAFFQALGVTPFLGRDFRTSGEGPHAAKVVILSDRLWRHLFYADPMVIGQQVKLDGDSYSVIGVMPRSFDNVLSPSAQLWTPDGYDSSQIAREFNNWEWGNHVRMVGRLRPGVARADAVQELAGIARTPWSQFPRPPWASLQRGLIVDSLQDDIAHTVKPALLAVFGAVIIVLAIACVNVINLLLARSAQRAGEFAVRRALGASRRRIMRQLVTESILLTFLGGALGVVAAVIGVRVIVALSPSELPRLNAIAFDPAAFLFSSVLIMLIGLAAGIVPALHHSHKELQAGLQRASLRTIETHQWTRSFLVVGEIAMAFVLLVSAGLLLRSMQRLLAVNPGFGPLKLLTMQVTTSGHQFDDSPSNPGADRRRRFFEQDSTRFGACPALKTPGSQACCPSVMIHRLWVSMVPNSMIRIRRADTPCFVTQSAQAIARPSGFR